MLFLHETHTTAPHTSGSLEAAYRDEWMPRLAESDDARLLWFAEQTMPGGAPDTAVTITAVRDGAAWERLSETLRHGRLEAWRRRIDGWRRRVVTKILVPMHWSPLRDVDLATVPVDGRDHDPTLYLEDTMWPYDGKLLDYVDAAGSVYVERGPGLLDAKHAAEWRAHAAERDTGLIKVEAAFQPAFGSHRRKEAILWQPIYSLERLAWFLVNDLPPEDDREGSWMRYALSLRDQYQSKLLRTARWSPWY